LSKILLFDVENSPSLAYIWRLFDEVNSMDFVESDWYILCWAAKWLGKKTIHSASIIDFEDSYMNDAQDDKQCLLALWELLNETDVVVAHNGKRFDVRKINARFIYWGIKPPKPYRVVDTLQIAREYFSFTSNRLGDLGEFLGCGGKVSQGTFKEMWKGCMQGCPNQWRKMIRYCKGDIDLLEKVYLKIRPYAASHVNVAVYDPKGKLQCVKCGSYKILEQGYHYTNVSKFKSYSCKDCGGWSRARLCEPGEKTRTVGGL